MQTLLKKFSRHDLIEYPESVLNLVYQSKIDEENGLKSDSEVKRFLQSDLKINYDEEIDDYYTVIDKLGGDNDFSEIYKVLRNSDGKFFAAKLTAPSD